MFHGGVGSPGPSGGARVAAAIMPCMPSRPIVVWTEIPVDAVLRGVTVLCVFVRARACATVVSVYSFTKGPLEKNRGS